MSNTTMDSVAQPTTRPTQTEKNHATPTHWKNWSGMQQSNPQRLLQPTTVDELARASAATQMPRGGRRAFI